MTNTYALSRRRAVFVRGVAGIFLFATGIALLLIALQLVHPTQSYLCTISGCIADWHIIDMAPDDQQAALRASPAALATFTHYVARPDIRAAMAAVMLLKYLPFAVLLFAVAQTLLRLAARRGDDLARALPWFRIAAATSMIATFSHYAGDCLWSLVTSSGTPEGPTLDISPNVDLLGPEFLLALAAIAIAWAIDAGSRAERDAAAFV